MAKTNPARARGARSADPGGDKADGESRPRTRARKRAPARGPRLPATVATAVRAAQDKKAFDLVVLDLRATGGFTDYFVICTGGNSRQITAIADAIRETIKNEHGEGPALSEGVEKSEWILLDYFDFVVHVFSRECRAFYGLERLWGGAEHIAIEPEPDAAV